MFQMVQKIGNNCISQTVPDGITEFDSLDTVTASWENALPLTSSTPLRPPQVGALYAIKAHWTVSSDPATVVMPTGTGKTETMIATLVSEKIKRALILVPSNLLRKQTFEKFKTLGILPEIKAVTSEAHMPIVTCLTSTPQSLEEVDELVQPANVIVSTFSLFQRFPKEYFTKLEELCDLLIVDEAHHVAAKTWSAIKYSLNKMKCLQFTATPFRCDGKKLDGKIIYNFPLALAQKQGYFEAIHFNPIWEFDEEKGDLAIALAAIDQLKYDISAGYDHTILVRAKDKKSADKLFNKIYAPLFPEYNPVLIHSGIAPKDRKTRMNDLKSGHSKIVVCVDMFGEGIDIPNLKIAAIHEKYKSLPITLQFIGRFARTKKNLGPATVITNIANDELNESLQDLYSQDSDWNMLLNAKSASEIGREVYEQEFADGFDLEALNGISIHQMRPKVSMTAYTVHEDSWNTTNFLGLFDPDKFVYSINSDKKMLVIIERVDDKAPWTTFKGVTDTTWHLHIAYWNVQLKLLYINSTDKGFSDVLAEALFPTCTRIKGEQVFRCLAGVKRLMLGTVGLKTGIDGPIRFRMFAGFDIVNGIAESLTTNSYKSNLFGIGYNGNGKVSIGCSHKGRIWSRWVESVVYWSDWCDEIGNLLLDSSIDTKNILAGALVPESVTTRPASVPYSIDWPVELDLINEDRITINRAFKAYPFYAADITLINPTISGPLEFKVSTEDIEEQFELRFVNGKVQFVTTKANGLNIQVGTKNYKLSDFFEQYPPQIKFVDQSILEGNTLVRYPVAPPRFNPVNIQKKDWQGTDIRKESQGKQKDTTSIQYRMIQDLIQTNRFCIVFDDDGAGEVADIVCIEDGHDKLEIELYHCKYSHGDTPGSRVADLYEVCCQAEKSIKWCNSPQAMIGRLIKREVDRNRDGYSRIDLGSLQKLREIKNKMRLYPSKISITIVQPGVDSTRITDDMSQVLSGSAAYLLDTYSITLKLICS